MVTEMPIPEVQNADCFIVSRCIVHVHVHVSPMLPISVHYNAGNFC